MPKSVSINNNNGGGKVPDGFQVKGKTPDGKFLVFNNGMQVNVGSQYSVSKDENGQTVITLSPDSVFKGTAGEDNNIKIVTDNSTINLYGGGDKNVSIWGNGNKIKEVNDDNHAGKNNEVAITGDKNIFLGGTNTELTLKGNDNSAKANIINSEGNHNYLMGTAKKDWITSTGLANYIDGKGGSDVINVNASFNLVADNNTKQYQDSVKFNSQDKTNRLVSKSGTTRYYKETDSAPMIVKKNGKVKEVVEAETETPDFSNFSNQYVDPETGKTITVNRPLQ